MITEFSNITNTGVVISLDISNNSFIEVTKKERFEYINSMTTGLRWENDGKVIELLEEEMGIKGYPFPSLEKVLVAYYRNDNHPYSSPRNAAIYNADGSLYLHLEEPKVFLSDLAKKQRPKPYFDYYDAGNWKKNDLGQWVMSIYLVYNYYFYEGRVIDEMTGELGEVVDSGRY